ANRLAILLDFKFFNLAHEIAQFLVSVVARIEVGMSVGQLCSDATECYPAIRALHLPDNLAQRGSDIGERLQLLWRRRCFRRVGRLPRRQVLGVDESPARLPKALRGLALTEAI